ncbi:MAG: AAA domain-containing protein [Deltaproteobacteria bacterium]|nr:AAA domain-containing protein [Deltaproteobacteria bacterium]
MTERSADEQNEGPCASASTTLIDGTQVQVQVQGANAETRAKRALAAAAAAATEETERPTSSGESMGIIGESAPMQELYRLLDRIVATSATVLITGENGTGKELVAKAIHNRSSRSSGAFVATNCSAFNDNLLESELFGHKRGSFTGAVGDKPGLFAIADTGTFFLDEVGDMSPALQVKLLRVLQEGTFMPVGATQTKKVDVRILAATNRDLMARVREGYFREDLFYRLNVVALHVPPLRDRTSDIPLLTEHFLDRLGERDGQKKILSRQAMRCLGAHNWPGNVRELENEIERLWVLAGDEALIDAEHLTPVIADALTRPAPKDSPLPAGKTLHDMVDELERSMIDRALEAAEGNKTLAAELLGISRRNLIRKVQVYESGEGKSS